MNNGMMMLIAGLGLLWFLSRKPAGAAPAPWIGGSQAAQQTAAYEIGF
jgi:hypothetical protein